MHGGDLSGAPKAINCARALSGTNSQVREKYPEQEFQLFFPRLKQDSSILEIASERCMLAAVKEERVAMSHKWLSAPTTTDKVCPTVCDNSSLSAWELPRPGRIGDLRNLRDFELRRISDKDHSSGVNMKSR